ncbi:MAG: GNAT family N-acetyltransferase [Thermomicrobiales bacterium]
MTVQSLANWTSRATPAREPIIGKRARLEPIDPECHGDQLFAAANASGDPALWDYLPYGPFVGRSEFLAWLARQASSTDPLFFAIVDQTTGNAVGMCSFLRLDPEFGVIEIGHIWFSPILQRTPIATEAIYLMQKLTLGDLGYRRLEWKCDNANDRSKRAAERFGFTFEGVFRQHRIVKGKNRDTAWFSILDSEWQANQRAFEDWLSADNFDADGKQRRSLSAIRAGA